jgi:hypothetical protein
MCAQRDLGAEHIRDPARTAAIRVGGRGESRRAIQLPDTPVVTQGDVELAAVA